MLDIILAILCFTLILVLFKLFSRFGVDDLQALLVNYFVAGAMGIFFNDQSLTISGVFEADWLYHALTIGVLFITVFILLAKSTQKVGIAISTVANKMSVVIPVTAAFFLYNDSLGFVKIGGILLALAGVYLTSTKGRKLSFDPKYLWLVVLIFLGQGMADIIFNHAQQVHVNDEEVGIFFTTLFGAAAIGGTLALIIRLIKGTTKLQFKNILWGIGVGVPNYLTLWFFFRALESGIFESSQIYPFINIGVVILSALIGFFAFKEKLGMSNWLGIIISVLAIGLISFS